MTWSELYLPCSSWPRKCSQFFWPFDSNIVEYKFLIYSVFSLCPVYYLFCFISMSRILFILFPLYVPYITYSVSSLYVPYIIFFHGATAHSERGSPHYRDFTIALRHTTIGRIPLGKWSSRRRDLFLTTHNTQNRQTSMPPVGFEPTISPGKR